MTLKGAKVMKNFDAYMSTIVQDRYSKQWMVESEIA
jgi:hypothetical protein